MFSIKFVIGIPERVENQVEEGRSRSIKFLMFSL